MNKVVLLCLFVFSSLLSAQKNPQEMIDKFFKTYETDKEKAIKDLYLTNSWSQTNTKVIENFVKIVNDLNVKTVGKYYGYEFMKSTSISKSLEKHYYVLKYDRQPVRIVFNMYKPENSWMLYYLQIDDNIEDKEIIKESK